VTKAAAVVAGKKPPFNRSPVLAKKHRAVRHRKKKQAAK
jgi:hypothetical protein